MLQRTNIFDWLCNGDCSCQTLFTGRVPEARIVEQQNLLDGLD